MYVTRLRTQSYDPLDSVPPSKARITEAAGKGVGSQHVSLIQEVRDDAFSIIRSFMAKSPYSLILLGSLFNENA